MHKLKSLTSIATPFHEQKFQCPLCDKIFMFTGAFGGNSKRGASSYLKTRFAKHLDFHHSDVESQPKTELQWVRNALERGNAERALRVADDYLYLGKDRRTVGIAAHCIRYPRYEPREQGVTRASLIAAGMDALNKKFNPSSEVSK